MRGLKTLMFALLTLLAFGAFASAVASADSEPALLILEGKVSELKFQGEGGSSTLSVLGSESFITGKTVKATLAGCLELGGSSLDTNLCHEGLLEVTGVVTHKGATETSCRSENLKGEADPAGVVLAKIDAHLGAEESTEKVLEPLAVGVVLGVDGTAAKAEELRINCTAISIALGRIGCLVLPGLVETETGELLCKTDETEKKPNGDQLTGTCTVTEKLCKELKEDPFSWTFGKKGEVEEMAALLVHAEGKTNKMVFVDD